MVNLSKTFIILAMIFSGFPYALANSEPEERIETAFVYQFAKYIEWPNESEEETFSISLIGESPIWKYLQELAREKRVKEKLIEIHSSSLTTIPPKSNVVILSSGTEDNISGILKRLKGTHALTISHGPGLAEKGVMINFYVNEDKKLRFEINRKAAEAAGLVLSSQILKLAKIIE